MTLPQWSADIAIDASLALRRVADAFPELSARSVEPFGIGWDNAAFLIDATYVFRFPRRRICAKLIEREAALLPALAPNLPIAISAPCFVGRATADYPYVFAGYARIAGETACSVSLSDEARAELARPLARFLRALHAIDVRPGIANGLPEDELGRLDGEKRLRMTRERLQTLPRAAVPERDLYLAWLEAHPPVGPDPIARRLVHGDLYARHLLLDANGSLTGVIDWGDVHYGDPAIDIAIAHLVLPAVAHAAFRAEYGSIDERTWMVARYRAIYHAILEVDYGVRANDGGMRNIGTAALRLMREAPA